MILFEGDDDSDGLDEVPEGDEEDANEVIGFDLEGEFMA